MTEEISNSDTQTDEEAKAKEAAAKSTDSTETDSQGDGLSLEDLNKTLGKEFKDKASALKALKETQDFVGEKGQKLKEAELALEKAKEGSKEKSELEKQVESLTKNATLTKFLKDNPEMDNPATLKLLEKYDDPYEAVKDDNFKTVNDPLLAYNKVNNSKSIIHKNSRLGQVTNKIDESKQSLDSALNKAAAKDQVGAMKDYNKAKDIAVGAVLDAVEKKE